MGSPLAHENEAPFPDPLSEFLIRNFCSPPAGIVDPFCGSGTTVAVHHSRRALVCDLRPSQVELSRHRIMDQKVYKCGSDDSFLLRLDQPPARPGGPTDRRSDEL